MIDIPLTEPQEAFCFSDATHPAITGGLGSGKSRAATMRLVLLMLENVQHTGQPINTVYGMPTYDLLNLRAMPGVEQDLEMLGIRYKTNKSNYSIDTDGFGTMIFRSYDRPERWVAFECAHGILDELDTLPKDKAEIVWRKASERIRSKSYRKNSLGVVTTPDQGVNGFVYEKWEKKRQPGYQLYRASTYSNPYLPDGYIEQIRANYDPTLAELYLNGEFVSLSENKVYHYFKRAEHHSDRVIRDTDQYLHVGLDFNVGGCVAVVFVIDGGDHPVAVDEFVSHDTYDIVNNLTARYRGKHITLYPDASGRKGTTNASRSDISILESGGFRIDAPPANPAVRDRINSVNALLAHGKLSVNTDKCPNFTHALEVQGYTERGEPEKFNDHPTIDDWVDAPGYFISRRWPVSRPVLNANISMWGR